MGKTQKTKGRYVHYQMPTAMAFELLKSEKVRDHPTSPVGQQVLCRIVNEQFNILGDCVRVVLT